MAGKASPRWARHLDRAELRPGQPQRRLMAAVLRAAVEDIRDTAQTNAVAYVTSTDRAWPFSFENLCEALDMDAGDVRRELQTKPR
jgi:hypothetical protein